MIRLNNIETTGFPVTGATLLKIDEIIGQVASFASAANGDNYISSGVENIGNSNYSDGWIVWNGEILPFQGGVYDDDVTIVEENFTATYQDQQQKGYYVKRYAKFGNDGVETFDFTDLKPAYTKFANGFLNGVLLPYTGLLTEIPTGFELADGTNGKPSAGGRVFKAIENGEGQDEIGLVGGSDKVYLAISQLPKFTPTGSLGSSGAHSHNVEILGQADGSTATGSFENKDGSKDKKTFTTDPADDHTHILSMNEIGKGESFDNRQAFIKGAYMIWVGF